MRLGIDMDGVICEFNAGWMRLHNDEFGGKLHPEMVTTWNGLHELGGFDDMDAFWEWARPREDRSSIFRHLELVPGAVETLRSLERDGHEVVIVSSKPDWAVPDTLRWLADHEIPTREIHFTYSKHQVACDVYLDDAPVVLPDLVQHRPEALVCRFVRPWNRPIEGAVDVANWPAFDRLMTKR